MRPWVSFLVGGLWVIGMLLRLVLPQGVKFVEPAGGEISPAQEQAMWQEIQKNIKELRDEGVLEMPDASVPVPYIFPLRLIAGLPDYAGFRVSAFVDHNPASGQVLDYSGGARTYDGHRGTDYALWPFSWNKVDAGEVDVIAAVAGTIVAKADATPADHNCGSGSSDPWNYIALLHSDGRMTIYGHMRYQSLTHKVVGESVIQGEYLGKVASSGNSSGPHLHFEVRYGSFSNAEWVDPYSGVNSQPESLWISQLPYRDSAINKLSTHFSPPSTPDPCQPGIPNLQDAYTTPARIYFYAFYRDYQSALVTQLKIYRPDGSVYSSWQYAPGGSNFYSAWNQGWVFDFTNNDPSGTWRFESVYNGQVYETYFNLNSPPAIMVGSPNGGEKWPRMVPHPLTWTDNLGGEVNIALYHNGVFFATIASNEPSDGLYFWTPGASLEEGTGYSIRISSVTNPLIYDLSDASFSLQDAHLLARDDFILTAINAPVPILALANDENPTGETMNIIAVGLPTYGAINWVGNDILYTPGMDFLGTDVFTYTVSAGLEQTSATVTVQVVNQVYRTFLPITSR